MTVPQRTGAPGSRRGRSYYLALAGTTLAALLGVGFVLLGLELVLAGAGDLPRPNASTLHYMHLFGVRDAFLGAFALVLLIARQRRALLLLFAGAAILPVADTIALAGPDGLAHAAGANLPFVVPLVLTAILLAAPRPRPD